MINENKRQKYIKNKKYECVYPFEEQSSRNISIRIKKNMSNISERKPFAPDCELEIRTLDGGGTVEMFLI